MQTRIRPLLIAICAMACTSMAFAEVTVPAVFGNDMVLQRELPVPVWGTASPGEKVSVSFDGQNLTATADGQGRWMVKLEPLKTSKTEKTMTIKGTNTITFTGVLVGEVWFCSGQSNMAGKFVANKGRRLPATVFEMDLSGFRFTAWNGGWRALAENNQNFLSCVAYYFGIELYKELDVPIGLIIRSHSGTPIQAWMPADAAEVMRKQLNIPEDWYGEDGMKAPGVQFGRGVDPIAPYAIRGAIWYQGERNAKTYMGYEYDHMLTSMINIWRAEWATRANTPVRNFPFYYVQVPTQAADGEWPWLRDRMRRTLDMTKNTGMAVYYDYGPAVHPPNKEPLGERLALWAFANDYGRKNLVHCGPLLDKVQINNGKAVLSFKHVGGGLKNKSGEKTLKFFEIAQKDGKYLPAEARIEGDTVVVQSKKISAPVYVRYLFRKAEPDPEVSLINTEGLPASPFITDDFKPIRDSK